MVTPTFNESTFWYRDCDFQTFVTFWRQTDRQSRRQCEGSGDIWGGDVRPRRQAVKPSPVAVLRGRHQSFYAVISDVIKGSTRSSSVTSSSSTRGRAGFKGQCAYQLSLWQLYMQILYSQVRWKRQFQFVTFYPTDFNPKFYANLNFAAKIWMFW